MRVCTLAFVLLSAVALPAAAQAPADGPVRRPSARPLDLSPDAAGGLRALDGFFSDISTAPGGPSLDGPVTAVAVAPDGSFYVAGEFSHAGGTPAATVARWDGTQWSALGGGLGGDAPEYTIDRVLALGPDGSLYAGGSFTTAGGATANGVARWDGAAWHAVGGGVSGSMGASFTLAVYALAFGRDGSLYVGGQFVTAGGVSASSVARWDGTAWTALGSGVGGTVRSLAVGADGLVYVGGSFTRAGEVAASRVARWDGAAWSALESGTNSTVQSLAIGADGSLYAGGAFSTAGGVAAVRVARWNGTAWSALGSGVTGQSTVSTLAATTDGSVYAGGYFQAAGGVPVQNIARWDGAVWSTVEGGVDREVFALTAAPGGGLVAGGRFSAAGGQAANAVARWNGTAWTGFGSAFFGSAMIAFARAPNGDAYVGGSFGTVGDVVASGIARWDGAAWHALGTGFGLTYGFVGDIALAPNGDVYAAGDFTQVGGVAAIDVARWDGAAWRAIGSGVRPGLLSAVYAVAVGPDGTPYVGGRNRDERVYAWSGAAWVQVGAGLRGNIWDLAFGPDGHLYAGGELLTPVGERRNGAVARWDGTTWRIIGTANPGRAGPVFALAFDRAGHLYAGGYFSGMDGGSALNVARWDGTAWHALGNADDVPGHINALHVASDGRLYAGGYDYERAGRDLIRWDGTAWTRLGPTDGNVWAITEAGAGEMLVGGYFQRFGGVLSPNIVRYAPAVVASEPEPVGASTLRVAVSPNPSRGAATVTLAGASGEATVEVVDALGRRVARIVSADGRREVALPDGLVPGVYVVRVTAGGETAVRPFVVVR